MARYPALQNKQSLEFVIPDLSDQTIDDSYDKAKSPLDVYFVRKELAQSGRTIDWTDGGVCAQLQNANISEQADESMEDNFSEDELSKENFVDERRKEENLGDGQRIEVTQ